MQLFLDICRWFSAMILIISGISGLKRTVFGSWMGPETIIRVSIAIGSIAIGILLIKYRFSSSRIRQWRWVLGFFGLILLPTLLLSLMFLFPPNSGPGYGGAYAAGAVGQALVLSLYASPILAFVGFTIGLIIDNAKKTKRKSDDTEFK